MESASPAHWDRTAAVNSHHAELDVRFEKSRADLAQRLVEVGVGEPASTAQARRHPFESVR